MNRSFLLLQGMCTPFFSQLGGALRDNDQVVHKVNFNGGDSLYWRGGGSIAYRGELHGLEPFYESILNDLEVTDLVLFGDCRPLHSPVKRLAERRDIRIHVFEEGYFRPYWLTLERRGVNAYSELPRDAEWYRHAGRLVPDYGNGEAFASSFWLRAWHDVAYHFGNIPNPLLYPGYRTHAPVTAPVEYYSYLRRAVRLARQSSIDAKTIAELVHRRKRFWLLPLQLNADTQIRHHSPFHDMREAIEMTMKSFAEFSSSADILVIKNHPLDTGLCNYAEIIPQIARHFGVNDRVIYLESGHLPTLLNHARGVVTVNSTVGGSALVHSRPTIALANAIYNMPGLTFQGSLDDFWRDSAPPDAALFQAFRNVVIHTTQVNGGFYSSPGIRLGVQNSIPRLLSKHSLLETLEQGMVLKE